MAGVIIFDDSTGGGFGTFYWGNGTIAKQESLGLTDEATTVTSNFVRNTTEELGIGETATPSSTFVRTFTDELGITENVEALTGTLVNVTDFMGLSEAFSVELTIGRTFTDALGLTDEHIEGLPVIPLTFIEATGLSDLADPFHIPDQGNDQITIHDTTVMNRLLSFTESTGLTDTAFPTRLFPTIGMSRPFNYDVGWRDVINKVELTTEKRYLYPEEVVWEDKDTKTIQAGETYVYKAKANDPFMNAVVPVPGLKSYSASEQIITPEDYDFLIESGTVSVTISRTSGQSLEITVTALDNAPAVISNMSLRAQPAKVSHTFYNSAQDVASQRVEGIKSPSNNEQPPNIMNTNDAKAIMEVILNQRFKKLPFVNFVVHNGSVERMRSLLDLRLSDRVQVVEEESFTNDDFYVEQISHSIEDAGTHHKTVVGCEQIPSRIEGAMIFDDPSTGFDVGVFGDRANTYDFDNNLFIVGQSNLDGNKVLGL